MVICLLVLFSKLLGLGNGGGAPAAALSALHLMGHLVLAVVEGCDPCRGWGISTLYRYTIRYYQQLNVCFLTSSRFQSQFVVRTLIRIKHW